MTPKTIKEEIYDSIADIISNLQFLKINTEVINNGVHQIVELPTSNWKNPYVYSDGTYRSVNYLAIFAILSFHYWTEGQYWQRYVDDVELYGSYSLMYILKKAIEDGIELYDPETILKLSFEDFRNLLIGHDEVELPYLKQRFQMLLEVGQVLKERFGGSFVNLFEEANYDVNEINFLLVKNFRCLQDKQDYGNQTIKFYKKSQEIITLVYEQFEGKKLGAFKNMPDLTVSSDYKLPQMMNGLGYLSYSPTLEASISSRTILAEDSRQAIEIRAATIEVGRIIAEKLSEMNNTLLPFQISNRLWTASQTDGVKVLEHPRIEGIWV
jgi:hypothetical protein